MPPRMLEGCPRSPATSPVQYPAGSEVGVSVLLRQAYGFERRFPGKEKAGLTDPPATEVGDDAPHRLANRRIGALHDPERYQPLRAPSLRMGASAARAHVTRPARRRGCRRRVGAGGCPRLSVGEGAVTRE